MRIPERYLSRYPHYFDPLFIANAAAPPSTSEQQNRPGTSSHDNHAAAHQSETVMLQEEVLKAQRNLLKDPPPSTPLLTWSLDILAGKVLNVTHDTTVLLEQHAMKKSWMESDAGRYEKAQAAATFTLEQRKLRHTNYNAQQSTDIAEGESHLDNNKIGDVHEKSTHSLPPGSPGQSIERGSLTEGHETVMTPALLDHLITALGGEMEEVKARFSTLLTLPPIEEKVEIILDHPHAEPQSSLINPYNPDLAMNSDAWNELVLARRLQEAEGHEERYQHLTKRMTEFTTLYREQCQQRMELLTDRIYEQRSAAWKVAQPREKIRLQIEAKNNALTALLKRAKDAQAAAAAQEAAAEAERLKQEAKNAKNKKK